MPLWFGHSPGVRSCPAKIVPVRLRQYLRHLQGRDPAFQILLPGPVGLWIAALEEPQHTLLQGAWHVGDPSIQNRPLDLLPRWQRVPCQPIRPTHDRAPSSSAMPNAKALIIPRTSDVFFSIVTIPCVRSRRLRGRCRPGPPLPSRCPWLSGQAALGRFDRPDSPCMASSRG